MLGGDGDSKDAYRPVVSITVATVDDAIIVELMVIVVEHGVKGNLEEQNASAGA